MIFFKRFRKNKDKHYLILIAGAFGNILEWYDFALYGFMAVIISDVFFANNGVSSLIATYGVFAIGFLARPVGAWLFGYIGDRVGRKPALLMSVLLMGVATFLLGCLPAYSSIGKWAPILLVLLRLAQGLSVGGEFSTSVTYMVENAGKKNRGVAGSFANVGSMLGMLLGVGAAALVTSISPQDFLYSWGWRLPFFLGGFLAIIAILLRRHLPSQAMKEDENRHVAETPLREALTNNKKELMEAISFSLGYAVFFYLALVYLPTYAKEFLNIPLHEALQINTLAIAVSILLIPLAGIISDRLIRRRSFLLLIFATMFLLSIPVFLFLVLGGIVNFFIIQIFLVVLIAFPLGTAPAMYVELFPKSDRLTAYSITFNVSLGIFGGTTPLIATWLIHQTGNNLMPAFYLMATLAISLLGLFFINDRSRETLLK